MNKKFKLEKVLELREKALEREKIKLADLQQKEKEAREEINIVIEDIKSKNDEMEQDRAKGHFDFIEMYNKCIEAIYKYEEELKKSWYEEDEYVQL